MEGWITAPILIVFVSEKDAMKESRLIKCEICGDEFHPYSSSAKYCSDKCRKIAHAKQTKQWAKEHRKEINERQKKWRKDHPEEVRKYNRKSYLNHIEERRERIRDYNKKYYCCNREKILAYQKAHREERRLADRRRYWEKKKKMKDCQAEHDNCFSCPTPDGDCLFN